MENALNTKLRCPIAIKWPIAENRLKALKDKPGEVLSSIFFNACNIPGLQYYIKIYPNENKETLAGQASIFLHLKYNDKLKIEANLEVKIESANYSFKYNRVAENLYLLGGRCCTTEELFDPENRFIVDGKMIIQIEGSLMVEKEMPKKGETFGDNRDALCLGLWNQEENKDIIITADGKEVTAHKLVLATRSPVFAAMFQSGMKEAKENKVEIKDFSFDIVQAAVKLFYHHSLVTDIKLDDKMKLLSFFDKYEIHSLKNDLEAYLISGINESNVCCLANTALNSNSRKLKEKCVEFLHHCLKASKPICDFDLLDKDFALNLLKNAFCQVA
uniref:BTB domain-containing protein n=1 Tax=Panagrolaimus superbus TaxID=310955 RepID=A0A914Z0N3_9BILA